MCLGIPGEVLEIDGERARVSFRGAEKWVRIDIVGEELAVGEYVLNHAGFAIRKIPESEVERTVELYEAAARGERGPALDGGRGGRASAGEAGTAGTADAGGERS